MQLFQELTALVHSLDNDIRRAASLRTPNAEDDLLIRLAIIGFSYSTAMENWTVAHFRFVNRRLTETYSASAVVNYGVDTERTRMFCALCLGYALGFYEAGRMSDMDLSLVDAQLPALLLTYSDKLGHGSEK